MQDSIPNAILYFFRKHFSGDVYFNFYEYVETSHFCSLDNATRDSLWNILYSMENMTAIQIYQCIITQEERVNNVRLSMLVMDIIHQANEWSP